MTTEEFTNLDIPEEEISEDERKEIRMIIEEMKRGKEHRLEDVLDELNVSEEDFQKFQNLAERWKGETFITSAYSEIVSNLSYLEIIKMGKKVLPYIFQDLKSESAFWFSALQDMTGCDPVKPSHSGIIKLMKEDWLKWGEEHGYMIVDKKDETCGILKQ